MRYHQIQVPDPPAGAPFATPGEAEAAKTAYLAGLAERGEQVPTVPGAPVRVRCRRCGAQWPDCDDIATVGCTCKPEDEDWVMI